MIQLTTNQVAMAEASMTTLDSMKRSKLYREESGELVVSDKASVIIITNSYKTNSNINSNHSSVTVTNTHVEVFVKLGWVAESLGVAPEVRESISNSVDEMECNAGSFSFLNSYQKFISLGRPYRRLWPLLAGVGSAARLS